MDMDNKQNEEDSGFLLPKVKRCLKCGVEKPIEHFHKAKSNKHGVCSYCSPCHTIYMAKRRKENDNARIANQIRCGLVGAIKHNSKRGKYLEALGCSVDDFKKHIESLWQDGMTWENHGEWQFDHIKSLSSFTDLTDEQQYKEAVHYTNVQPLWKKDNYRKGSKSPN